jgi:hypothetical protein
MAEEKENVSGSYEEQVYEERKGLMLRSMAKQREELKKIRDLEREARRSEVIYSVEKPKYTKITSEDIREKARTYKYNNPAGILQYERVNEWLAKKQAMKRRKYAAAAKRKYNEYLRRNAGILRSTAYRSEPFPLYAHQPGGRSSSRYTPSRAPVRYKGTSLTSPMKKTRTIQEGARYTGKYRSVAGGKFQGMPLWGRTLIGRAPMPIKAAYYTAHYGNKLWSKHMIPRTKRRIKTHVSRRRVSASHPARR